MMEINIPVSIGELFDKYVILKIKEEKIKDPTKLENIKREISFLKPLVDSFSLRPLLWLDLFKVNGTLWKIEDRIREKERKKEFDAVFISLARRIYKLNDRRAKIKRTINEEYGSQIVEEKSYGKY